MTKIGQQLL